MKSRPPLTRQLRSLKDIEQEMKRGAARARGEPVVFVAPATETQKRLAQIWREVLKVEEVGQNDNFFNLGGHSLGAVQLLSGIWQSWGKDLPASAVFEHPVLADLARTIDEAAPSGGAGQAATRQLVAPNLIPPGCERIVPEMLTLVPLQQTDIDRIAAAVPGGAANIQDIYPLVPLQEGIFFHHLLDRVSDAYVLPTVLLFEERAKLDGFLRTLQRVIERHDILRTAVLWEGLPRAVQVVYRRAPLQVETLALEAGPDPQQHVQALMRAERMRMPLDSAPLLSVRIAAHPDGAQWLALVRVHHIACDQMSIQILLAEAALIASGREAQLAEPVAYREFVARVLAGTKQVEAEAFFKAKLGDVDGPTAPFDLLDVRGDVRGTHEARLELDKPLARRLRSAAAELSVTSAALFHAAYGAVVACTSAREDVVFGSVLSGRSHEGGRASRTPGMFINTLPLRLKLAGASARQAVLGAHQELAALLQHEHVSLASAQRCSALPASLPLFTAVLNYRQGALAGERSGRLGIKILAFQNRTNYPITFAVDDTGESFALTAQTHAGVDAGRLAGFMARAVGTVVEALETAPESLLLERVTLAPSELQQMMLAAPEGRDATRRLRSLQELRRQTASRAPATSARTPAYVAPTGETETRLAALWAETLNLERVGAQDNFFELGGHSLRAMQLLSRIWQIWGRDLPLTAIFEHPVLAELAAAIDAAGKQGDPAAARRRRALPKAPAATHYPPTAGQRRLWLFQQMFPASSAYHMVGVFPLQEGANTDRLLQVLRILESRHPALRTVFAAVDGEPVQKIRADLQAQLRTVECVSLEQMEKETEACVAQPFDLANGPLVRVLHVRVPVAGEYRLVWVVHHIVCDGVSLALLGKEILALVKAPVVDASVLPPPPANDYVDYACWQATAPEMEQAKAYWRSLLEDPPPRLSLPADYAPSRASEMAASAYCISVPPTLMPAVRKLCVTEGVTPFMVLLAGFIALMRKLSGQSDLLIGVPGAGRIRPGTRDVVGFFANITLVRSAPDLKGDFAKLLAEVRVQVMNALRYQDYPFDRLLDDLGVRAEASAFPLTPVFFNMLALNHAEKVLARLETGHRKLRGDAKVDWDWYLLHRGDSLLIDCHYKRSLFHPETVAFVLHSYVELLQRLLAEPAAALESIPALLPRTPAAVPARTRVQFPFAGAAPVSLPDQFERVAARYPQRLALQDGRSALTYAQLDERRRALAARIASLGISSGERVGLLFDHDAAMIVAVLAVLSAGAAYVPLDPRYPAERLRFSLKDSGARVLLTDPRQAAQGAILAEGIEPLVQVVPCDNEEPAGAPAARPAPVQAESAAYILYTSGSTGTPKGVLQSHGNVLYHIACYANNLAIRPQDNLALFASYSFDAAVMDIFGALLSGAVLTLIDIWRHPPEAVQRLLNDNAVTIAHLTPTVFRHLFDDAAIGPQYRLRSVRLVVLGGETCTAREVALFRRIADPQACLINGLGPTESTLALQHFMPWSETDNQPHPVPVGHGVGTTHVDLCDERGVIEQCFAEGEIVIRTPHVALGYWQRPELTATQFGEDERGRFYRTGDYGKRWIDGSIRFIGRRDQQVKIRGLRIELGEIEAAVCEHPAIQECVCLVQGRDTANPEVAAFVVWRPAAAAGMEALQRHLAQRLPATMWPSRWIVVPRIPRTPTGKLHRAALAEHTGEAMDTAPVEYAEPEGEIGIAICGLIAQLLKLPRVGMNDHFFGLGGHSLLAMRLIGQVNRRFGVEVPIRDLFENPTVGQLVQIVEQQLLARELLQRPTGIENLETHEF